MIKKEKIFELKIQEDMVLSDVNSIFMYGDNVLAPEGYDYCFSLSTSVDKRHIKK